MRLCELDCQRSLVYEDATFALLNSLTLSMYPQESKKEEGVLCECKKRVDVYKFDRKEEKQNKICTYATTIEREIIGLLYGYVDR